MPRYERIPPRRPVPWSRTLRLWATLAATVAGLIGTVVWSERLPIPAPATAAATDFSAARAWPVLAFLADTLGTRLPGSPQSAAARSFLEARLRSIPGLEVTVQDTLGVRAADGALTAYRVRNVVARLPGRERDAVLLAAHYDSPAGSVGAADDAVAVAALVEVARALAAGPQPRQTVLFLFGDAEEQGLLGADAFMKGQLARDVRAFVNLESAGNAGKAILFQAGPGNHWLVQRYAAAAPFPYGTVLGQDIFQSGLIPSGTDFEVYAGGGWRGLDMAFYRGGWAYHTALDRAAAVQPGSVQHMGANTLAVARSFAAGPLPGDVGGDPSVYYDVLGLKMVRYTRATAAILAVVAALALLVTAGALVRRGLVQWRSLRAALIAGAGGIVAAVCASLAGAALVAVAARHPHGWFAHPWRGVAAFAALSATGLLVAQWRLASRSSARDEPPEERMLASWIAAFILMAAMLAALTAAGIGSAYLLLWWVGGGAASLWLLSRGRHRRWVAAAAMGLLPGALLTIQTGYLAVELFAPIAGRFPSALPFDFVLASLTSVVAVLIGLPMAALVHQVGRPAAAAAAAAAVAVIALAAVWLTFPFSASRPQRLTVTHEQDAAGGSLVLRSLDAVGPLRAAAHARRADATVPAKAGAGGAFRLPAPLTPIPPPALELVAERRTRTGRSLEFVLRDRGAYSTTVLLQGGRRAVWTVNGVPPDSATRQAYSRLRFVAAPDSGWRFSVDVPGTDPLQMELRGRHAVTTHAAAALLAHLPPWATVRTEAVVRASAAF